MSFDRVLNIVSCPDLIPTAADGLHHRYVERGSGELLYSILSLDYITLLF